MGWRTVGGRWTLVAIGMLALLLVVNAVGMLRERQASVKSIRRVADATPTSAALVPTLTPRASATAAPSTDLARGAWLFESRGCAGCHGAKAEGAIGRKLAGTGLAFDDVRRQVRFPVGEMFMYPEVALSENDLFQIWSWLGSLGP